MQKVKLRFKHGRRIVLERGSKSILIGRWTRTRVLCTGPDRKSRGWKEGWAPNISRTLLNNGVFGYLSRMPKEDLKAIRHAAISCDLLCDTSRDDARIGLVRDQATCKRHITAVLLDGRWLTERHLDLLFAAYEANEGHDSEDGDIEKLHETMSRLLQLTRERVEA